MDFGARSCPSRAQRRLGDRRPLSGRVKVKPASVSMLRSRLQTARTGGSVGSVLSLFVIYARALRRLWRFHPWSVGLPHRPSAVPRGRRCSWIAPARCSRGQHRSGIGAEGCSTCGNRRSPGSHSIAMEKTAGVDGWVDRIDDMSVGMVEQSLAETGLVPPPRMHALLDGLDLPYVGYLTCRPMYRGQDALQAVRVMGLLGSMLLATRLVVTFENADLCTALQLPGADDVATGVAVVDADRAGSHVLRWHPATFRDDGPPDVRGAPGHRAVWGRTRVYGGDVQLPVAVAELLGGWRHPRTYTPDDLVESLAAMETSGYVMRWVARPEGERDQPAWMRLLAPIM